MHGEINEPGTALKLSSSVWLAILLALLILVSLYDLFSPPITPTGFRQTQTAMLTENFVKEGFSISGLYVNLKGPGKLKLIFEFPIYNFIVGIFFLLFGNNIFWTKLVSLICSAITLLLLFKLVKRLYGESVAVCTGLFFIFSPLNLLMGTSAQPDALGLMFLMVALTKLFDWQENESLPNFIFFSLALLGSGLAKYPIMVPYLPVLGLGLLYVRGRWRMLPWRETAVFLLLFVGPLVGWYLYRFQLNPEMTTASEAVSQFLIGDLSRFMSWQYYVKPAYVLGGIIFCGAGLLLFLLGLRPMRLLEVALVSGIPFYFLFIPTVRDQYYYLYAALPIFALFMGRGLVNFWQWCTAKKLNYVFYGVISLFALAFMVSSTYVLRHDTVIWDAAQAIKKVSAPGDLIFIINMHDRGNSIGGINPEMVYLSQRKGWNIQFHSADITDIEKQIETAKRAGARWVVLTWYTPDQESWFVSALPKNLRRYPGVDGYPIYQALKQRYRVVASDKNYAIMSLGKQ
jgi:hypothetical protein